MRLTSVLLLSIITTIRLVILYLNTKSLTTILSTNILTTLAQIISTTLLIERRAAALPIVT